MSLMFAREGDVWAGRALTDGDMLAMPEIGVEMSLAEIYADIELPVVEDDASAADR